LNTQRKLPIVKQLKSKPILLILGDYDAINTENLLNLISLININTLHKFEILFKSHPGSENQLKFDFKRFKFKIVNNPISELLIYSNIVCSTNSTSASVEAFCFGLDILIYNSYNNFNMSPLKDVDGVVFFENSKTLETLLINFFQNFPQISSKDRLYKDYFYINTDLSNWKKIINQYLN
jgi:surface carbohydrate biosynthesis protein (TIGR04326 family)